MKMNDNHKDGTVDEQAEAETCRRRRNDTATAAGKGSIVPFSERPYGSSFQLTLRDEACLEDVKDIIMQHKEHCQTMPGFHFSLLLEDITCQFIPCPGSYSTMKLNVPKPTTPKKRKFEHSSRPPTAPPSSISGDNDGAKEEEKESHSPVTGDDSSAVEECPSKDNANTNAERRCFCFGLWNNQEAEAKNLFHTKTLEAAETLLPLVTSFPRYQFWVQVQGHQLSQKKYAVKSSASNTTKTLFEENETNNKQTASLLENNKDVMKQASPDNQQLMKQASQGQGGDQLLLSMSSHCEPTDIITVTRWQVSRSQDMDSCFSMLRRLRQYALSNHRATSATEETGDGRSSARSSPHRCKQYDIYLTYNHDNPNVFMEMCVWTSHDAFKQFLKSPNVRFAHAAIKSRFCESISASPSITIWRKIA